MQRWLRGMAPAIALRCKWPLWAGLRRGYQYTRPLGQVRTIAQAAAHQSLPDNNNESSHTQHHQGVHKATSRPNVSPLTNWYTVRQGDGIFPVRDIAHYSRLPEYPRAEDYQQLPKDLFALPPNDAVIDSLLDRLRSQDLAIESKELLKQPDSIHWRYAITVRVGDREIAGAGEDGSLATACTAAFMGVLHQLHINGLLEHLITPLYQSQALTETFKFSWAASDVTAKLHVHNFAARFLATPEVEIEPLSHGHFQATVAIPNTEYEASSTAENSKEAEFMAYAVLKQRIEKKYVREGRVLDLRDANYVNIDNAQLILNVYKSTQRYGAFTTMKQSFEIPGIGKWASCSMAWETDELTRKQRMPNTLRKSISLGVQQLMPTTEAAEDLMRLEAAITLVKRQPDLFQKYQQATHENTGLVPLRYKTQFASLNPDIVATLGETVEVADEVELDTFMLEQHEAGSLPRVGPRRHQFAGQTKHDTFHDTAQSVEARSHELKMHQEYDRDDSYMVEKLKFRSRLPVFQHKTEILAMIKNHDQCIVVGSTGSGKSTQVPQIILDDAIAEGRGGLCNIICTQPRRISAVSLALNVCDERQKDPGDVVGYRIAGDSMWSRRGGSITYCTTELAAIELERGGGPMMDNTSHIIVDEIHERSVNMDRLLANIKLSFMKRMAAGLRVPKLVLMSATIESNLFERYFEMVSQDGTVVRPPFLNVPGRRFTTSTNFLESFQSELPSEMSKPDSTGPRYETNDASQLSVETPRGSTENDLVHWRSSREGELSSSTWSDRIDSMVATIVHVLRSTETGSILAFVPGAVDIRTIQARLLGQGVIDLSDSSKYQILLLHSSNPEHLALSMEDAPPDLRRIMVATNIAESSLTFPDVQYVVDSGLKRNLTDSGSSYVRVLQDELISKANVLQRAGRAGRTGPGHYYGTFPAEQMQSLSVFPMPEVLDQRRLQDMYLRAKIHFPSMSVHQYFGAMLSGPSPPKVQAAAQQLQTLGALTDDGELSSVGYFLYRTLLPPTLARMVLLGVLFKCLDQAIILASILNIDCPLFGNGAFDEDVGGGSQDNAQSFARDSDSDIIAKMYAFENYNSIFATDPGEAKEWAIQNRLGLPSLERLSTRVTTVRKILAKANFFRDWRLKDVNDEADNQVLLKMLIFSGLYPNVAVHDRGPFFLTHRTLAVRPAPYAVAMPKFSREAEYRKNMHSRFIGSLYSYTTLFTSSARANSMYMADTTPTSPLTVALFSRDLQKREGWHNELLIDGTIPLKFSGDVAAADTFLKFKKVFDTVVLAGMQNICEIWPSAEPKIIRSGMIGIVLQAALELLDYENGQAKKRTGDVGVFQLGVPRVKEGDEDEGTGTWVGRALRPRLLCKFCGGEGHVAADCPEDVEEQEREVELTEEEERNTNAFVRQIRKKAAKAPVVEDGAMDGLADVVVDDDLYELPGEVR